jgi:NAD(P)-dependent dehydrogenase (short-subunit alcohol dehydrogenase family)
MENTSLKSTLITGASTGIGAACALHLDRLGFRVFAGVRREADGEALRRRASSRLRPVFLDVTDPAGIGELAGQLCEELGESGLAGLVNNAGVVVAAPLEFLPIADLRWQLEVNVVGQIMVTQAFLPLLRRARGRIVNMSSTSGRVAGPFLGPYSASKFALEALSDALRVELRPSGITVSVIEPGRIATPIWEKSLAAVDERRAQMPPEFEEYYGPVIPTVREMAAAAGRSGVPALAVARAVEHALCARRPKARYLFPWQSALRNNLLRLLPVRLRDWLIAQRLGIRSPGKM